MGFRAKTDQRCKSFNMVKHYKILQRDIILKCFRHYLLGAERPLPLLVIEI